MKNIKKSFLRIILLCGAIFCSSQGHAQTDLLNLPEPPTGTTRYLSYAAIEKSWPTVHGQGSICFWGDDKFAAASLTIDDNNYPDVTFWRQVSAEFGWKLTWFLIVYPGMWDIYNNVPGNNVGYNGSATQWKALHNEGHEIALHGSCAMNTNSEAYYLDHMNRSIAHLESVISNNIVTYAYPCGTVDSPTAVDGFRNVCSSLFIGARGTTGGSTSPFTGDYMNTSSMGSTFSQDTFDKMEDNTRPLLYSSYRGWAVFLWHGLLGDTNKIAGAYQVFNYLDANRDKYWIKTFGEVARYAQERESGVLNITSVAADQIQFTLTDSMTNSLFNYPLTVKFRVDNWADAVAVQNGQSIPVSLMTYSNSTYALVQAVPDQGTVVLSKAASAAFSVSPSSGWAPLTVTFTDTSTYNGITNRYWNFGDGVTTNTAATNITHIYTVAGTNTVQLIVSGAEGVYTNTQTAAVIAIQPVAPNAGFSATPSSGSTPLTVTFTDTSTGSITNRYWNFGDGATTNTTSLSVVHTYTAVGTNAVQLIVTGPAGASTNTQVAAVTVMPPAPPSANFTALPISGFTPLAVAFTDTSTGSITNRFWSFGDGATTNTVATSVLHTYTSAGTLTVQLIVSGPSGVSTNTQSGLITAVSGSATGLIVYDPFNGAATSTTASSNTIPTGWVADTATNASTLHGTVASNSLSYSGLAVSQGNSFRMGNKTADYYLDFTSPNLTNAGQTVYFSLLVRLNSETPATMNSGIFRLFDTADPYGSGVTVGLGVTNLGGAMSFSINNRNRAWSDATAIKTPMSYTATGVTYLIVASYTRGAAATTGETKLWINPDSASFGTIVPPAATVATNSYQSDSVWNRLQIISGGSGSWPTNWQIDEVRIGTDWASVVPSNISAPNPDSDNDGIPDEWENQYFGGTNANPSAPAANGVNTIYETYIAGLNPTNPQAVFALSGDQIASQQKLQWDAVSGRVYSVYWTTNLLSGFQPLETNILWPQNSWTDAVHGAQADGFYRIRVQLNP
jgi:PKD repeat protein/peptidoglycan/xylan/chitin deacetylase (PgdA/CDA1 family)